MRVLVCGGRNYGEVPLDIPRFTPAYNAAVRRAEGQRHVIKATLDRLDGVACLIQGGAKGADRHAAAWARDNGVQVKTFSADWSDLSQPDAIIKTLPRGRRYDANAGPRRNARMLAEGLPDLVVAFPGRHGTDDMVRKAEAAGISIIKAGE